MVCLNKVVRDVSARAEFKDMRKRRDNSRVTRAFLGVSYIGKLVRDDSGWQGTAEIPVSRSIAEKRYREEAEFPLVPQKREAELSKFQRFLESQQAKLGNKE
ncbi:STAS domain-containing protein [Aduncisulcus paluster]|uniref:STAS domain-containing protein n=1 Tax=Aduncisulcus paluster TaxID=2918883 RepID=A0ABQ5K842_9EUKA|nr:STAS domain-containing protein [Aduncisulcus paluster]